MSLLGLLLIVALIFLFVSPPYYGRPWGPPPPVQRHSYGWAPSGISVVVVVILLLLVFGGVHFHR